jgi:hypothetical protein
MRVRSQRRTVFLNKNPHHSYRVRLLDAIFPDCKFIHVIRDGRAVAYSEFVRRTKELDDKPIIENILKERYKPERSYIYNIGQEWHCSINLAREAARYGQGRYLEIRYEDLIQAPMDNLSKVLHFCNIDTYDDFLANIPVTRDENVKWKANLDNEHVKDLEESTHELRKQLNYM